MNRPISCSIEGYEHRIGSHCESGTVRNLLMHAGIDITEQMVFGVGSGIAFYYVFFIKGPSGLPLVALRTPPGSIVKTLPKLLRLDMVWERYKTTDQALEAANRKIDAGIPVAISVDMFYMKYLPRFIQVHAPFHFVVLVGRDGDDYAISDPYYNGIGRLGLEHLRAAWQTNAPMAKDNSLIYVNSPPAGQPDLKAPIARALKKTCNNMRLPPVIRNIFSVAGVEGIRTYAKNIRKWPSRYRGVHLREGILFNAIAFEDQGTGGGAFRLMYGAFLQEAAEVLHSKELADLASRIVEHGNNWKELSRKIIRLGKTVPIKDDDFEDWYADAANRDALQSGLNEVADAFMGFADVENVFFKDLSDTLKRLP